MRRTTARIIYLLFAAVICLAGTGNADRATRIFGGFGKLQSLALSPDGTQIAFSSDYRDAKGDIVIYDMRTQKTKFLTISEFSESQPVFSPDGQFLYYFSNDRNSGVIYRLNLNSLAKEAVTNRQYWCEFPAISPDGKFLVYYSRRDGKYKLYGKNFVSGLEVQLTTGSSIDFGPIFSSDGKFIYFYSDRANGIFSLFKLNLATRDIHHMQGPGGFAFQPTTDFKGNLIYFVSANSGNKDIFSMSFLTGEIERVTAHPADDLFPVLDKDRGTLYYISLRDGDSGVFMRQQD